MLTLDHNKIAEIKGLDTLVKLTTLQLDNNQIMEIQGLDTLTELENLHLDTNQLTELKGMDNLKKLSSLYLGLNPFEGEAQKFAPMNVMGTDHIQELLRSYKEWKKQNA